ncbi:aldo/keto reductase [Quadrisphaera sp. KR29]|uniref:aldo/keto reductase n=1 Tax=Quadrisphaera sp. KR29 TaxID=3461391 RepID=UPI004044A588
MTSLPSTTTTSTGTGTVPLGDTGIGLHPLCLGGNVFGWSADEEASRAVLDAYAEAGGNLVDTADVYSAWVEGHSGGESESVIGRWLADRHPGAGAVHVATKTGAAEGAELTRSGVDAALDASLGRLGLDSVALYYAHRDQEQRPVEEVVQAFAATVTDGRARAWAVSNWSAERIDGAVAAAREAGVPGPVAVQNAGSAVTRTDPAVVDACRRHGLLAVPYGALASGFLTGKYTRGGQVPESVRAEGVGKRYSDERSWAVLDAVRAVAEGRGAAMSTVALAWLRAQGAVPIASARTPEQLTALLAVTAVELSADELEAITTAGL